MDFYQWADRHTHYILLKSSSIKPQFMERGIVLPLATSYCQFNLHRNIPIPLVSMADTVGWYGFFKFYRALGEEVNIQRIYEIL